MAYVLNNLSLPMNLNFNDHWLDVQLPQSCSSVNIIKGLVLLVVSQYKINSNEISIKKFNMWKQFGPTIWSGSYG